MFRIDGEYLAHLQKVSCDSCTRKFRKHSFKALHRNTYFTIYCEFVCIIFSKIAESSFGQKLLVPFNSFNDTSFPMITL